MRASGEVLENGLCIIKSLNYKTLDQLFMRLGCGIMRRFRGKSQCKPRELFFTDFYAAIDCLVLGNFSGKFYYKINRGCLILVLFAVKIKNYIKSKYCTLRGWSLFNKFYIYFKQTENLFKTQMCCQYCCLTLTIR